MSAPHFRQVCSEVAERRGITLKELYRATHAYGSSRARQEAFYLLWRDKKDSGFWRFSLTQIAAHFGLDHSTVLYGIQAHMKREGMTYVSRSGGKGAEILWRREAARIRKASAKEEASARWNDYCRRNGWPMEATPASSPDDRTSA